LEQGRLLRREGKDAETVPVLEQALALRPGDFDIEAELGSAYSEMGQNEKAARLLEHALAQRPREYALTVQLAKCYERMGRLERARKVFGLAKKIDPKASQAYIEQGYMHLYAGESDAARQEFESLIAVDTSGPLGYHHMGRYLFQRGDYREAEGYFLRAIQRLEAQARHDPSDMAHALLLLGIVRIAQRKQPEAEAAWRQGLAVAGAASRWQAKIMLHLSKLSSTQGRMVEAERYYRQALAVCEPDSSCPRQLWANITILTGNLYAEQGRKSEAQVLARRIRDALRGMPVDSDNVTQVNDLAYLLQRLGDAGEAEALWGRIVAARESLPNHLGLGRALAGLAGTRMTQGRLAEARDLYLQAIDTRGLQSDANEMADALNGLAGVYDKEGRSGGAQAARRRAEELKAHSGGLNPPPAPALAAEDAQPQALLERGRLLRREGKDAEAVPVLEQALALQKDDFDIESELGPAYDALGRYEQAAAAIEKALQQKPQEYGLLVQLAKCYVRMGRLDRAREAFGRAKKIDPKASQAYIEQGYAHLYAGEFDAARREFKNLIAVDTSSPLGYYRMGFYLAEQGDYREAAGYCLRAVQLFEAQPRRDPDEIFSATDCLGKVRQQQRKYPEAEAAWRRGLALPGISPYWRVDYLSHLCSLSTDQGRRAEAERYCRQARALCESDSRCPRQQWTRVALKTADLLAADGRKPEARALAQRIRDGLRDALVNGDNVGDIETLADQFQRLGDTGEAEALWGRIVAARDAVPNHRCLGQALKELARVRLEQGRRAEARDLYLQAIKAPGLQKDANEMAAAFNGLAEVYDQEGRSGEAQAARRRAAEFKVKPTSRDPQR